MVWKIQFELQQLKQNRQFYMIEKQNEGLELLIKNIWKFMFLYPIIILTLL